MSKKSRLDTFLIRLTAQKAILEHLAACIGEVDGPVLELGLGNGRTFDHLRMLLPEREIFVFDRAISAHPRSIPDGRHMVLGEIRETLAYCAPRVGALAALVHCDLGTGDETSDLARGDWLSELIPPLTAPGGYVASGVELDMKGFVRQPQPPVAEASSYRIYRRSA